MTTCRTSKSALSQAENGRSKRGWSVTEESVIRSRTKAELDRLELLRKTPSTEQEAQALAEMQRIERMTSEYESVNIDLMHLYPNEFNRTENVLSRVLGIHKSKLGLGDDMTQAGRVKLQIADMKQTAQSLIDVTARYAFKKTTDEALRNINVLLKQRGIDPTDAQEFINHVGEVAKSPRQRMAFGNTEAINQRLAKRHNDMMDEARKLGLDDTDMDVIVQQLTVAMSVVDDVHGMARVLGASMGTVENIGYMMRTFTQKAEELYKLKSVDVAQWSGSAAGSVGKSSVQKSRESWSLIPEDYEVLAQFLLPGKHSSADLAGMVTDIHKMADDGQALTVYLHKNLSAQQLDDLVDSGILHKLEMTTREVADYMSRQYELPYQKALGMFEYDINVRLDKYADTLRKTAGNSHLVQQLITRGVDAGWSVPTALLTGEHTGFKSLGDIDLTRFGLDPALAKEWGGLHVHPTVHNQLHAYLELSTNPGKLSQFANAWSYVLRNFNMITLTASGVPFLSRNFLSDSINLLAGGGNMSRVIPSIHEYAQVVGKGGLEALDNVTPIVKWPGTNEFLTKREAFKRMLVKRGTDWVSNDSGNRMGLHSSAAGLKKLTKYIGDTIPVIALPNAIREQYSYLKYMDGADWGLKNAAKLGATQFNDYVRTVFAPIAYGNAIMDGGFKWAWMMSHLESSDGVLGKVDDFGSFISGGKREFRDSEDLFDQMDNYFISGNTSGTLQKGLAKYVVPFGMFAMSSTPMAIRHALRNPNQFMAYSRLIRMNHRENMRDPDIREAGYSEFELAGIPMTLFKDYKNPSQVLTLFPTNVDMYSSTLGYVMKQGKRLQKISGGMTGVGPDDRKTLRDPYGLRDFVVDNIRDNQNPVFALLTEMMSGKDSLGRDIDKNQRAEVGGADVNPTVYWLLSKLPGFATVNRSINGRGAITAPDGTIQAPAQPGLFGTPNREATRTEEARYRAGKFVGDETYDVIRDFLGLDVRTIDLAEGRQHVLSDVQYTITTLQKRLKDMQGGPDTPEAQQQREVIANQILQLKVDEHRVRTWMQTNNVPEKRALKKMQQGGITVRSLPMNDAVTRKLVEDYMNTIATPANKK